jgi:hypothetical protein
MTQAAADLPAMRGVIAHNHAPALCVRSCIGERAVKDRIVQAVP